MFILRLQRFEGCLAAQMIFMYQMTFTQLVFSQVMQACVRQFLKSIFHFFHYPKWPSIPPPIG